jgi:hypothetical protein
MPGVAGHLNYRSLISEHVGIAIYRSRCFMFLLADPNNFHGLKGVALNLSLNPLGPGISRYVDT